MHFNFNFSAPQILWTLTFAAQLILLMVLQGRDRARRYPSFTAFIVLLAVRLMVEVLLSGRMALLPLQEILQSLGDIGALVGVLMVVELARRAFVGATRSQWIVNAVGLSSVAVGVLVVWGPWPVAKELDLSTLLGRLHLMQLVAQKGTTLQNLLAAGVGLLVIMFGRRFKSGWRSHPQMIAIGLSTASIAWIAMQAIWQNIARTAHPQNQQQYDQVVALGNKLLNANKVVFLAALVWWIVWLWLDEPVETISTTPPSENISDSTGQQES